MPGLVKGWACRISPVQICRLFNYTWDTRAVDGRAADDVCSILSKPVAEKTSFGTELVSGRLI